MTFTKKVTKKRPAHPHILIGPKSDNSFPYSVNVGRPHCEKFFVSIALCCTFLLTLSKTLEHELSSSESDRSSIYKTV